MDKIDIVVTYLDSMDSEWQKDREKYMGKEIGDSLNGEARYRNMDNFKYWFRAIENYAPWVHRIHLVTYGHLPKWINLENSKLHIVNHKDFIPEQYLPTFNSNVIELNMDRIEGLAEKFINFNDDFFLNAPVEPTDFFVNDLPALQIMHTPIPPTEEFNVVLFNNILAINEMDNIKKKLFFFKTFSLKNGLFAVLGNLLMFPIVKYLKKFTGFRPDHLTQPLTKSTYKEVREQIPEQYEYALNCKFRDRNSIGIWVLQDYLRAVGNFYPKNTFKFGSMTPLKAEVDYERLMRSKYKVLCINDGASVSQEEFEKEKARLNRALENKFPQKSSFEL